jgi:hypothetical protein
MRGTRTDLFDILEYVQALLDKCTTIIKSLNGFVLLANSKVLITKEYFIVAS